MYRTIQTYISSEHPSGLVSNVYLFSDVFLIPYPSYMIAGPGYYDCLLVYAERAPEDAIDNIIFI